MFIIFYFNQSKYQNERQTKNKYLSGDNLGGIIFGNNFSKQNKDSVGGQNWKKSAPVRTYKSIDGNCKLIEMVLTSLQESCY